MGLSNFPSPAEGVLPLLLMNMAMSVALVKNKLRSLLQVVADVEDDGSRAARTVSITRYGGGPAAECCVCLCRFEADEEVSELSCKHFFHKACLDKWFHNRHITCPLCRSIF
ncbi:probable E3 ubiquitin-protein ligase XERICO [Salvia hispanica]|uniref:probable E3 ubiquitin-protein ligase XERICO n=1 Tax=Salvia hispanica TaxID=49212 RepID=UPI002009B360|nr:probable E3 ubiquitin-protein ligase XERICO [Salvia hispanica]